MGLRTLLVSGRRHAELVVFARRLGGLDGIVAENGAVVEAPLGSPPTVVGRSEMARLVRRLRRTAGIPCEFGTVIVSVPRNQARLVRAAVRGFPVRLTPNVDRLMILPRGITKRSGTQLALRHLGVARARYAAIGDAENDLALLRGASLSGAVANAERSVRSTADYVCHAGYAPGVLEFVRGPLARACGASPRGRALSGEGRGGARGPRRAVC